VRPDHGFGAFVAAEVGEVGPQARVEDDGMAERARLRRGDDEAARQRHSFGHPAQICGGEARQVGGQNRKARAGRQGGDAVAQGAAHAFGGPGKD
jgi:hypothetical protein